MHWSKECGRGIYGRQTTGKGNIVTNSKYWGNCIKAAKNTARTGSSSPG